MIAVPDRFAAETIARQGDSARPWLDRLPGVVGELCGYWGVEPEGPATHGAQALVVPVRSGEERYAIKVTWLDEDTRHEATALQRWAGNGAVRLLGEDPAHGAMLLERLDETRSLEREPHDEACGIIGNLARRLWVPPPPSVPRLIDEALLWAADAHHEWDRVGQPVPHRLVGRAVRAHIELTSGGYRPSLLHRDLDFAHVLAGRREPWLAIDPKPISGDPHYELLPLLRGRFAELGSAAGLRRRIALLADASGLDLARSREWALARAVDEWISAVGRGPAGQQQAAVVRTVAEWLAES
ncbi:MULTISPECIES: aminoglycoside phosphotransferase family protein [unclassified Crossiella]|uniref:aminoglycoside phosphotransferase family protein n=1 Tax=unclassified Crossiella TaxID=2620835 RepID=UPI001FFF895F|nr:MULTISPECIES: aminoglycoside phosphotransferase family protein [unclassified Crossiella]MCK2237230.1 aminoglycoside phosphotransferase family protein [Crossiella sp. S99.2]MCK2250885.1 aminoglycoside phosphotransferase family protein [Crossiella sp. S99.1]